MAYQNGSATSPTDLLQKLAAWALTVGWSQDMSQADGAGWRLHMHKGGVYINIRSAINTRNTADYFLNPYYLQAGGGIWSLYCGDGFSSGTDWRSQSGGPKNYTDPSATIGVAVQLGQGAIAGYHFFSDETGDNIAIVVEKTTGVFVHCGWGTSLKKVGAWTGGAYFFGTDSAYESGWDFAGDRPGHLQTAVPPCSSGGGYSQDTAVSFVRADVDSFTGKWIGIGSTTTGNRGYTGKIGSSCTPTNRVSLSGVAPSYRDYAKRLTNKMTGQSLLLPTRLLVARDTSGYSFLGTVPGIFVCNACQKGYTPATVYQWGADNYMVFPGNPAYPEFGFAIRKVG